MADQVFVQDKRFIPQAEGGQIRCCMMVDRCIICSTPLYEGSYRSITSLRRGAVYSSSWKQKLVTCSSTNSKVVSVYNVLPQLLWTAKFLKQQALNMKETILYQDNMRLILLEKNGCQSSTKQTKHMDI